ncbi:MAG: 30S ribosomal protein S6 [Candidatus Gracilibacteria bacterium]|nr:30S ribosomal protein S6 [Candidatus Gracilibacteria bacterium]
MANYELMAIIDPSLSEADRNELINELKSNLEKNSAKIEKEDVWGDKKMSYKINKSDRGFYILYELDMDGKQIKDLSKTINLNKNIWRYMFVKKEA